MKTQIFMFLLSKVQGIKKVRTQCTDFHKPTLQIVNQKYL